MAVSSYGSKGPPSDAGSDDKKQTKKKELCLRELIRFATYHDRIQWQTAYGSKGLKIEVSL